MENRKQRLIDLLVNKSLIVAAPGESFTLASNKVSTYYLDVRKTALSPEGHHLLGNHIYQIIHDNFRDTDAVAGVALGGCPIASSIAFASFIHKHSIPALYIRKEVKEYGTRNVIEGDFYAGMHVVLVEDVVTTGQSSLRAINALTIAGIHVIGVITVVDREEGGAELVSKRKIPFISLCKISEVLDVARANYP